jgi:AraC-like DNA-binding protein
LETSCVANENEVSQHYKIYWIEEGFGEYQIDFESFTVKKAGLFFLSPGQVFTVETEKVKSGYQISFDREFYCVETHGKEIACNGVLFNNVHRASVIQLDENDVPFFWQIIQNMINELEHPGPAHREMLETYLRMLLIQALRKWDADLVEAPSQEADSNRLVGDFIALVDKHFRTIHSVAEYAEKLFVTPKSLSKRLKAANAKTPTEIIRDRITLQAKRDLRYTNKSVKEIAFELGFEDPAYFTRLFKKATGQSPQNYRAHFLSGE